MFRPLSLGQQQKWNEIRGTLKFVDACITVQFIQKIQQDGTLYKNLLFRIYI
jgi:hypothetical protein